jgi:DNA replicative helicase MCM subunit Mcm2 (Cdc46/Mcm family)
MIIKRAKSFNPELNAEAENLIIQYWTGIENSKTFSTNRAFETIVRTTKAFARLHFSNIVTYEIAKEAIDFLTEMHKEFDSNITAVQDPRDITCYEIMKFLQEYPDITYDLLRGLAIQYTA